MALDNPNNMKSPPVIYIYLYIQDLNYIQHISNSLILEIYNTRNVQLEKTKINKVCYNLHGKDYFV